MRLISPIQEHTEELQADVRGKKSRSAPDPVTGLTDKQELFAQEIIAGANFSAAYRAAYASSGMADATIWARASELASDGRVAVRLEQLAEQKEAVRRTRLVGREAEILAQIECEAFNARSDATRLKALELLGRAAGLFVDRVEVQQVDRTADEIEDAIRARLAQIDGTNPDGPTVPASV